MNAITSTRIQPHSPADWPPAPGMFRIRKVRGGPFVAAQIKYGMGLWSAEINGQLCGVSHTEPQHAAGVAAIWECGTRIDFDEFTDLITNRPPSPDVRRNPGAMPPVTFEDAPPPIGHNQPPAIDLAAALEPEALNAWVSERLTLHTQRAEALLAAHKRFLLITHAGITSTEIATKATELVRQYKIAIGETEGERVRIKAPVLAAQRAIDGAAKLITDPLAVAASEGEQRISVFMIEQDRIARAAAAEEADRAAEITARAMDHAIASGDPRDIEWAEEARATQERAAGIVAAPTGDLVRLRVAGGGGTAGLRDNWTYAIEDISRVPAGYLMINDAAVKAAIKATPKGATPTIAGLKFTNNKKASIR